MRDTEHVDIARAPAAAFGEQHDRQAVPLGEAEEPVHLAMVGGALGAGEYGVVVCHDQATRTRRAKRCAVDVACSGDESVGGAAFDEILHLAAPALRGERERAVFDERAGIAKRRDVLAGGPLAFLAAPGDGGRTRLVERDRVTLDHLGKIGTHGRGVDGKHAAAYRAVACAERDDGERTIRGDDLVARDANFLYDSCGRSDDDVFHLHRIDHRDLRAATDRVAFGHPSASGGTSAAAGAAASSGSAVNADM